MKEKKLKYFIYDYQNGINTKKVKIEKYKYNYNTFVKDFYNHLLKKYRKIYKDMVNSPFLVSFCIENTPFFSRINFDTQFLYMDEIIHNNDRVHCIIPNLPIGGTFATYKNIKLVMHSNEDIHKNLPHIHVISKEGLDTRINLLTLEEIDDNFLSKKELKTINNYLKDKQDFLLKCYDDIINHKNLAKFEIDIIRD